MIVVIDYGMGNLGSVLNMLKRIGVKKSIISSDLNVIEKADKLILPGVGAFDNAMRNLVDGGFVSVLNQKVLVDKVPCLGICLGMQLLFEKSEEGRLPGLGWIGGEVVRFNFKQENSQLKIPHMGWNIANSKQESPVLRDCLSEERFYFVHSYHVKCKDKKVSLLTTHYGYEFTSGVQEGHIYGVQFHPEKSHRFGKRLLKNFCEL